MYDLPSYVCDFAASQGKPIPDSTIAAFGHAHRCACFYALCLDRTLDGQAHKTEEIRQLTQWFCNEWKDNVLRASHGNQDVLREIDDDIGRLEQGAVQHRLTTEAGLLDMSAYVDAALDKAKWLATTSLCMLSSTGNNHLRASFDRVFSHILIGMQIYDDALDRKEDEALLGIGIPDALGWSERGLFQASLAALMMARDLATEAGLLTLAEWISVYCVNIQNSKQFIHGDLECFEGAIAFSQIQNCIKK